LIHIYLAGRKITDSQTKSGEMASMWDEHVVTVLQMDIFDAADRYRTEGRSVVILAGKEYGSGSSRDWAAKGPWMLVRVVALLCQPLEEKGR